LVFAEDGSCVYCGIDLWIEVEPSILRLLPSEKFGNVLCHHSLLDGVGSGELLVQQATSKKKGTDHSASNTRTQ
jgi:hypothetical protein